MGARRATAEELRDIKAHARDRLGELDGVAGFGVGDNCLRIYVRSGKVKDHLPSTFDGVDVETIEVGDVEALPE